MVSSEEVPSIALNTSRNEMYTDPVEISSKIRKHNANKLSIPYETNFLFKAIEEVQKNIDCQVVLGKYC